MARANTIVPGEVSKLSQAKTGVSGFEHHRKTEGKANYKFMVLGAVIIAAALFIVFAAMQGSTVYYFDVSEVQAKVTAKTLGVEPFKMSGQVQPGTIVKDPAGNTVTFKTVDMKHKEQFIMARYTGVTPDTFKDEAQVVLTGKIDPVTGMFVATEMLAKCPSKYSTTAS